MSRIVRFVLSFALVASGAAFPRGAVADAFVPKIWNSFFTVSFVDCRDGDLLTDSGASGGTWGADPIPEDGEASVKDVLGEKSLVFVTGNENALAFTTSVNDEKSSKACLYRIKFPASEAYIQLPEKVKAAFTVACTNGVDNHFSGYDPSTAQWVQLVLKSGSLTPQFDFWYDCATRYKVINGVKCVSYYLKTPSGVYEPLYTEGSPGRYLFPLPEESTLAMPQVMFRGSGEIGDLNGVGQKGGVLTIR